MEHLEAQICALPAPHEVGRELLMDFPYMQHTVMSRSKDRKLSISIVGSVAVRRTPHTSMMSWPIGKARMFAQALWLLCLT